MYRISKQSKAENILFKIFWKKSHNLVTHIYINSGKNILQDPQIKILGCSETEKLKLKKNSKDKKRKFSTT